MLEDSLIPVSTPLDDEHQRNEPDCENGSLVSTRERA